MTKQGKKNIMISQDEKHQEYFKTIQTLIDMRIIIEYDRYNQEDINTISTSNNNKNEVHPRHLF